MKAAKFMKLYPSDFFRGYSPPNKKLNILLFGISTTGKSSTINNILNPKDDLERHAVSRETYDGGSGSLTQEFKRYQITKEIAVFDCWGWNPGNNYKNTRFEELLRGKWKNEQNKSETMAYDKDESTAIDIVVFVFDHTVKELPPGTLSKHLPEKMKVCETVGVPYMIAVTKIDLFFLKQKNKKNIMQFSTGEGAYDYVTNSEEWEGVQKHIYKLAKSVVVAPLVNERHGKDDRDKRCYYFCQKLVNRIKQVYKRYLQKKKEQMKSTVTTDSVDIFRGKDPILMKFCKDLPRSKTSSDPIFIGSSIVDLFSCFVQSVDPKTYRLYCFTTNSFKKSVNQRANGCVIGMYDPSTFRCFRAFSEDHELLNRLREIVTDAKDELYYEFVPKDTSESKSVSVSDGSSGLDTFHLSARNGYVCFSLFEVEYSLLDALVENAIQERHRNLETLNSVKILEDSLEKRYVSKEKELDAKFKQKVGEMEEKFQDSFEYIKLRRILEKEAADAEKKRIDDLVADNPSKILDTVQFEQLRKHWGFCKEWKLLLRGSDDGFGIAVFKEKCFDAVGTFIVIKTEQQNVLGGWTPIPWKDCTHNTYIDTRGSWIFGFDKKKFVPLYYNGTSNYGVYYRNDTYFAFGGGHQICIHNNCDQNAASYTHLQYGKHGYETKGYSPHFLNGGTHQFKVLDYEVYSRF